MAALLDYLPSQKPKIDEVYVSQLLDNENKRKDLEKISSIVQNFRLIKPDIQITNPHHKVNTILSSWDKHEKSLHDNLVLVLSASLELRNYDVFDRSLSYRKMQSFIESALDNVGTIEGKLSALSNANVSGLENSCNQVSILKWLLQFIKATIDLALDDNDSACRIFCILTNTDNKGFSLVKQFLEKPDDILHNLLLQRTDENLLRSILEKIETYKIESYTKAFINSSGTNSSLKIHHVMSEYLERSFSVMKATADLQTKNGSSVNPKLYKPLLKALSENAGSQIALNMGREMIRLGDYDNALRCINIASQHPGLTDMNRLDILYNLSLVYLHKENYQQILNDTSNLNSISICSDSSTYGNLLCVWCDAYYILGKKREAINSIIEALDYIKPGDSIYKYVYEKFVEFVDQLQDLELEHVYGIEEIKKLAISWVDKLEAKDAKGFPEFDDVAKKEISAAVSAGSLQIILYEQIYAEVISSFRQECYKGNLEGIKSLINNNKSIFGFTTLVNSPETLFYVINGIASSKEKADVMSFLKQEKLLELDINNGFALEMAVQKNDLSLVQFLMFNNVRMLSEHDEDGILLFYAAQKNNYDMFLFLKNKDIKVDSEFLQEIEDLKISGDLIIPNNWLHEYV